MTRKTSRELSAIQAHINRNFRRWFKTYLRLDGVHVGVKTKGGVRLPGVYSIVFHVTKKHKSPKKPVPNYITVKLNNDKKIKVQTDVIEAGKLHLHGIEIGDIAKNSLSTLQGTISCYFPGNGGLYVGSNMHVLAPNFIGAGHTFYDVRRGDAPQRILLFNDLITSSADLIISQFNGIDFGFAHINDPSSITRVIKQLGPMTGFLALNQANLHSFNLFFYGIVSHLHNCIPLELGVIKRTKLPNIFLTNLIRFQICTQDGDSGAAVFDQQRRMVGAIIGKDNEGSYALHVNDIISFFQNAKL